MREKKEQLPQEITDFQLFISEAIQSPVSKEEWRRLLAEDVHKIRREQTFITGRGVRK